MIWEGKNEMSGGRGPKNKGSRVERQLVRALLQLSLKASRVPLSGSVGGEFSGDIHVELLGRIRRIEVKARRDFRTLHGWMAAVDLLMLKADRQPPLVVMPLELFVELAARSEVPR